MSVSVMRPENWLFQHRSNAEVYCKVNPAANGLCSYQLGVAPESRSTKSLRARDSEPVRHWAVLIDV
jgi:hypothetical protein